MHDLADGLGLVRRQDHQQVRAEVAAIFGELHCLVVGPAAGGGDGECAMIDPVYEEAGELRDFFVAEEVELAVAVGEQADVAAAGDADVDNVADALSV